MFKSKWLVLTILLCAPPSFAETTGLATTERRIEDQKRTSLRSTEAVIVEDRVPYADPRRSIDRDFFKRLIVQPQARKVDGIYVVMVLLGKERQFTSFDDEFIFLKDNGYIPGSSQEHWQLNEPLLKGELAYMLCKALGIKGGVHMRIFGVSPRYAHMELVYQRIMISGSIREVVSGKELAYTFIQAADHKIGSK